MIGGIILSLLRAALTIWGRIHVEGVDNYFTVGAWTYRSISKYSQRFRSLVLVNPFVIFLDSISFIPGRLYQLSQFWNYLIKSFKSGSRYFAYCELTWLIISNQDLQ